MHQMSLTRQCHDCKEQAIPGRIMCSKHLVMQRVRSRRHYTEHRKKLADRQDLSQCEVRGCSQEKFPGLTMCQRHRDNVRDSCAKAYKANPQKFKDKRDAFIKSNPEYMWEYHIRRNRGVTPGQYRNMLEAQGGKCAIAECGATTPGGRGQRWHIDHDHSTGSTRGLLCHHCNVGLGNFKDKPELLEAAAAYLRQFVPN